MAHRPHVEDRNLSYIFTFLSFWVFSPVHFENVCFFHCEGVDRAGLGRLFIGGEKWHWIAPTYSLHLFVDFPSRRLFFAFIHSCIHGTPSRLGFLHCIEP